MMKRILPHPVLSLVLWLIWLLLNNSFSAGNMVLAAFLAIFIPWLTLAFWPSQAVIQRPLLLIKFIGVVLYEIIIANLVMAKLVLGPKDKLQPGFIRYDLTVTSPIAISLLANMITLTPGTVSCDLTDDSRSLLIHSLHIDDVQALKDEIYQKFERPLTEIFATC